MHLQEWVNSLSSSAAEFWGAVVGVGGGLIAILVGAFLNAVLNRRRDDRLRDQDARSIAFALQGELASIRLSVTDLIPIWIEGERESIAALSDLPKDNLEGHVIDAAEYAKLPPSQVPIFEANAQRIGLLGARLSGAVSVLYSNYRVRAVVFEQSFKIRATDLPDHFAAQIKWGENFCHDSKEIERLLKLFGSTGKQPHISNVFFNDRQN